MLRRVLVLVLLLCSNSFASDFVCLRKLDKSEADVLVLKVEEKYKKIESISSDFRQESFFLGLNASKSSKGKLYFKKPGMMSWQYTEPEKQLFVGDGRYLWFYQPSLNQSTVGTFSSSFQSDLPVSFLLGIGKLSSSFSLQSACESKSGVVLELTPIKKDEVLQKFYLLVKKSDLSPLGARVFDYGDNENQIVFENPVLNLRIDDSLFVFTPPKGVDVIDTRQEPKT